jgi:hypothetical protein
MVIFDLACARSVDLLTEINAFHSALPNSNFQVSRTYRGAGWLVNWRR